MIIPSVIFDKDKHIKKLAISAIIGASVIWGATGFTIKVAIEEIEPILYIFLRFSAATVLLLPWAIKYAPRGFTLKKWMLLLLVGALAGPVNYGLVVNGYANTNISSAAFIMLAAPVIIMILSSLFLKENITKKMILGLSMAFTGAMMVVLGTVGFAIEGVSLLGNALFIAVIIFTAITLVLSKKVLVDIDPRFLVWLMATMTFLYSLIFIDFQASLPQLFVISPETTLSVLWGIFMTTILAYYLYYYAIKNLKASDVGLFRYLDPLVKASLGFMVLGEPFSPIYIVGGVVVIAGIVIAETHFRKHGFIDNLMHPKKDKQPEPHYYHSTY